MRFSDHYFNSVEIEGDGKLSDQKQDNYRQVFWHEANSDQWNANDKEIDQVGKSSANVLEDPLACGNTCQFGKCRVKKVQVRIATERVCIQADAVVDNTDYEELKEAEQDFR